MKTYVVGFAFSHDQTLLILIQKHKPDWQKGKLNGLGGKIEPGETPLEAMIREFREEAGLHLPDWIEFATISKPRSHKILFFKTFTDLHQITHKEVDEGILTQVSVQNLPPNTIPNLRWLIPLALDSEINNLQPIKIRHM